MIQKICCHYVVMIKNKDAILKRIAQKGALRTSDLVSKLGISRQAIARHLKDLMREGKIIRRGGSRRNSFYLLNDPKKIDEFSGKQTEFKKRFKALGLLEDSVFEEAAKEVSLKNLAQDELDILRYAFTEMLNNAIDHSGSKFIDVLVRIDELVICVEINDRGIGAFENIRAKKALPRIIDAVGELLKGKQTTAPDKHSGEGIFFTSRVVDRFVLSSNGKRLTRDGRIDDFFIEGVRKKKGTSVYFELDLPSSRKLVDVFKKYTGEDFAFDKSSISVRLFDSGDSYISRSQAKRLLRSMESFRRIELDFTGVRTVGQGFVDEVFRVFTENHPDVDISWKGANEDVEFMIRRSVG